MKNIFTVFDNDCLVAVFYSYDFAEISTFAKNNNGNLSVYENWWYKCELKDVA